MGTSRDPQPDVLKYLESCRMLDSNEARWVTLNTTIEIYKQTDTQTHTQTHTRTEENARCTSIS